MFWEPCGSIVLGLNNEGRWLMINDRLAVFYEPHPGLLGCTARLPNAVKAVADELDGKTILLSDAIAKIKEVAELEDKTIEVIVFADAILLKVWRSNTDYFTHCWRVIKFRDA